MFRFFISDLSSKLAEIHKTHNRKQKNIVMLYRGLKLEADELKKLKENLGCIISTNGFLSTSHSKDVAVEFATRSTKRTNVVPVLYEIECNLNTSKSVVFADITTYSEFAQEKEVLFDLGSTFQIESIRENEQLKMVLVKLTATDAGMNMTQNYVELNRKMNEETTPDILFGILLIQMGKYDQSLSYFRNLLKTSNEKLDIGRIHTTIGSAYLCKGDLDQAHTSADHAYEMMIGVKSSRIKESTRPMTIMGHVYLRKEMYEKSLDFYTEALEIRNKFYGRNHLDTAVALNHIGNVYYKMEQYTTAFEYYEKSFDIRAEQLPHVHLDIAASLNNLGLVLWKTRRLGNYFHWKKSSLNDMISNINALECFRESLNIRKQILPTDHNDIIQSLDNIIRLLYENRDVDGSLVYFAELLAIQKIDFDVNDHDNLLSRLVEKLGVVSTNWTEYSVLSMCHSVNSEVEDLTIIFERFPHFSKAQARAFLEAEKERMKLKKEQDLSILKNFIQIIDNGGEYRNALETVKEILTVSPQHFISNYNHTEDLKTCLRDLVREAYDSTDQSKKGFRFYEKVQSILENAISYWIDTSDIELICLERLGYGHQLNGSYQLAVEFLNRSVKIQRDKNESLNGMDDKLYDIGLIYMILGKYNLALTSFKEAVKLLQLSADTNARRIRWTLKRINEVKKH
jgi:tetratricopeptide (TPR) repeat protein